MTPVIDEPLDESATPSQRPDVDIESLSESPSTDDYYLYSRIDGNQTIRELCTTSGLGKRETKEGLRRLLEMGLIEIPGIELEEATAPSQQDSGPDEIPDASVVSEVTDASSGSEASSVEESSAASGEEASESSQVASSGRDDSSPSDGASPAVGIDLSHLPIPPAEFDFDRDVLDLDVPLSDELKRELLLLDEQVGQLTHYQFFGVEREAPRGAIKKSYFKLSKRYHPDKHFRKEIGPYKEMLENVFQKITRAYRTLSNAEQRETYDRELAEREQEATELSQPSRVHMASESASSRTTASAGNGTDKRAAAFAQLVKKAERFRKHGEFDRAADHYRKALSLKRDLKVALQATRVLLNAGAQLDQAELFARAALRIDNEHVEARMMLGRVFERQEKTERAIDQYDRVLELDADHDKARTRRQRLMRN